MKGPRIGSLFSGAGGLDLAVLHVFGGRVAWHCEIEWLEDKNGKLRPNAAVKVLEHRFPGVPNLGDISAVDWSAVESVDILIGGFPCQDVSAAGLRAGIADGTRSGLWAMFAKAIAALRPKAVVIENVRGLLSAQAHRAMEPDNAVVGGGTDGPVLRAAGAVLGDLADLGYDAQWVTVSAASVGAPHERFRVFILAVATNTDDAADAEGGGRPCLDDRTSCAPARGEWGGIARGSAGGAPESVALLLPTPVAHPSANTPENHLRKKPGRVRVTDLQILVENGLLATGGELLPTPSVADAEGGHATRSGTRSHELLLPGVARAYGNGDLLPTPTARDGKGSNPNRDGGMDLPGALLPTPAAADGDRGADFARANRDGSGGDDFVTTVARATREPGTRWGKYEPAIRRWEERTRPAPAPTEPNAKGNPRLAPPFPEWMQGWPAGWVTAVPGVSRNDQLRLIGNGVCPQQAIAALRWLIQIWEVAA